MAPDSSNPWPMNATETIAPKAAVTASSMLDVSYRLAQRNKLREFAMRNPTLRTRPESGMTGTADVNR